MLLPSSSASSCSRSHMVACSSASSASSFSSNVRLWLLINRAMLSAVCCCLFTFSLLRYWCLRPAVRHLVITPGDVTENYHTSPVVCGLRDINTPWRLFFAEYVRDFLSALCAVVVINMNVPPVPDVRHFDVLTKWRTGGACANPRITAFTAWFFYIWQRDPAWWPVLARDVRGGAGRSHDRLAFVRSCVRGPTNTHPVPFFARFLLITGQMNPDCHVAKITLKRLRACSWADISTVMPICINPTGRSF